MARKPLGTYRRTTGDWFRHQRATAQVWTEITTGKIIAYGLFNQDQIGRVCHVLGVTAQFYFWLSGVDPAIGAGYYGSGTFPPLGAGDVAEVPATLPWFDLDPAPSVLGQAGYNGLSFPIGGPIPPFEWTYMEGVGGFAPAVFSVTLNWYPTDEIAAFKPGRGFHISLGQALTLVGNLTFDFVLLAD